VFRVARRFVTGTKIKDMQTTATILESLVEKTETYTKTSFELAKLKSLNATTEVVALLISKMAVIVVFALFTFVFNVGIALWLGELLGRSYYGFFIVAAFYLLAGLVLHFFLLHWIKKPVSELIIRQALQ